MQFDIFKNPQRGAYPLMVDLQADVAGNTGARIVAPLIPRAKYATPVTRLTPTVVIDRVEHVVLVPFLAHIPTAMLTRPLGSIQAWRADLVAALDLLFTGV